MGEDLSLDPSSKSQWIELYNAGAAYTTVGDDPLTLDVDERLTLAFYGRTSSVLSRQWMRLADCRGASPTELAHSMLTVGFGRR